MGNSPITFSISNKQKPNTSPFLSSGGKIIQQYLLFNHSVKSNHKRRFRYIASAIKVKLRRKKAPLKLVTFHPYWMIFSISFINGIKICFAKNDPGERKLLLFFIRLVICFTAHSRSQKEEFQDSHGRGKKKKTKEKKKENTKAQTRRAEKSKIKTRRTTKISDGKKITFRIYDKLIEISV